MSYPIEKSILVIGTRIPTPELDAGSARMIRLLYELQDLFSSVTFLPKHTLAWPPYDQPVKTVSDRLKKKGISIPSPELYDSPAAYIENTANQYSTILLSDIYAAVEFLELVRSKNPQANIIFDTVDLHYLRYFREAKLHCSQALLKKSLEIKKQEVNAANKTDLTLVVTQKEKEILAKECPSAKIAVLSGIYPEQSDATPYESRRDILFIGSFDHRPNLDAVEYFLNDIFPLLRRAIKEIKLYVIGANPPKKLLKINPESTIYTGYVPDLKKYFNSCRLSIAPLRFGAGMKGKILTSMSFGLPVIASSIASEGLPVKNNEHLFIADEKHLFAEKLLLLYQEQDLWSRFSCAGREMIRRHYSQGAFRSSLKNIMEMLAD